MTLLIVLTLALIVLGPGRRSFFRYATFTIPALLALVGGLILGDIVVAKAGVGFPFSVGIPLAMGLGAALGFGAHVKCWCDETFKQKGDRDHERRH